MVAGCCQQAFDLMILALLQHHFQLVRSEFAATLADAASDHGVEELKDAPFALQS
jgi:hypothetical protein